MAYGQKYQKKQTSYQSQAQTQGYVAKPTAVDPILAMKRLTYGFMTDIVKRAKTAQADELKQYVEMYCVLADRMAIK